MFSKGTLGGLDLTGLLGFGLEKVERGDFPDAGEVIREAMRLLDEQEQELQQIRDKLQVGLDQLDRGEHVLFTPELMNQLRLEVDDRLHHQPA